MLLALALTLLAPPPGPTYERVFEEYVSEAVVDALVKDNFDGDCGPTTDDARDAADAVRLEGEESREWTYSQLPDSFPGNAATAAPTANQTTTAERLAAAVETSVPGSPKVKAGVSVRPVALAGLKDYSKLGKAKEHLAKAEKNLAEAKKALKAASDDATAKSQAQAHADNRLQALRARMEAARALDLAGNCSGAGNVPQRPWWDVFLRGAPGVCDSQDDHNLPTIQEVEKAELVLADAKQASEYASAKVQLARAKKSLLEDCVTEANGQVKSITAEIKKKQTFRRRLGETWVLRLGSFEDLGVRAGTGVGMVFGSRKVEIAEDDFFEGYADAVEAECRIGRKNAKLAVEAWLRERRAAFSASCIALQPPAENGGDNLPHEVWLAACTKEGLENIGAGDRVAVLQRLGKEAGDRGCKKCEKTLVENPPTLKDAISYEAIEKRAIKRYSPSYMKDIAWSRLYGRASLDAFSDFEPFVFGFAPRDSDGNLDRLGRGQWRQLGGSVSLAGQGRGMLTVASVRGSAVRDVKDGVLQDPRGTWGLEGSIQCAFASLDRETPLRATRRDGDSTNPWLFCAPRKRINAAALDDDKYTLDIPYVAAFVQVSANFNARKEQFERTTLREASLATGFDFLVNEKLKFRLGVPVQVKLVEQKASSAPTPGPVIPLAKGVQVSIPFFVTTVLAL